MKSRGRAELPQYKNKPVPTLLFPTTLGPDLRKNNDNESVQMRSSPDLRVAERVSY